MNFVGAYYQYFCIPVDTIGIYTIHIENAINDIRIVYILLLRLFFTYYSWMVIAAQSLKFHNSLENYGIDVEWCESMSKSVV